MLPDVDDDFLDELSIEAEGGFDGLVLANDDEVRLSTGSIQSDGDPGN